MNLSKRHKRKLMKYAGFFSISANSKSIGILKLEIKKIKNKLKIERILYLIQKD